MAIDHILEMLDRAHQGPVHTAKEWNIRILPTAVSQKLDEHRLRQTFDRENPINADDALADEFFKAGFELAVNLGLFCRDTERAIKVTEDELSYALKKAPSELALGEGMDRVVIKSRTPEDKYQPLLASSLSVVISEDIWVRLMQGIVQNREVDIFQGGSLTTIFGRPVLAGTPYETLLGRYVA